jgi:type VI secretion system secreted protein VgrG
MDSRLSHEVNIMSLTDTLKNTLEGGPNRYPLDIPSCLASLDVEEFNGKEFMSELYHYDIFFTSSYQINS